MKRFLKLSVTLSLIFAFNSCQNDGDFQSKENENVIEYSAKAEEDTPDFHLNKYDYAGRDHNIILENVVEKWNENLTMDDYINFSRDEFFAIYSNEPSQTFPSNTSIINVLEDADNDFANVIRNTNFNTVVKQHLSDFIELLVSFEATNNNKYSDLKNQIISFETKIISDNSLLEEDKEIILSVTSIGRHSAYFWNTTYLNALSNGYVTSGYVVKGFFGKRPFWKWATVIICDVAGGISGGAAAGAVSGGVVLIAGAVAGAAGASSGASSLVDWISPSKP